MTILLVFYDETLLTEKFVAEIAFLGRAGWLLGSRVDEDVLATIVVTSLSVESLSAVSPIVCVSCRCL